MRGEADKTLKCYVKPENTVLIIVDMQEAFLGENAAIPVPNSLSIIEANKLLIKIIRQLGIPIIWTQVSLDKWVDSVYSELWPEHFEGTSVQLLSENMSNFNIVNDLSEEILDDDFRITKYRYSAFYNPKLKDWLDVNNIENILFSGVTTNVCVESSIRDAFQMGYRPFLISDATGTFSSELQTASESIVSLVFGYVIKIKDIEQIK